MTDRERQLIEGYIPHPKDPDLEFGEYYVLDMANRVQRVRVRDIAWDKYDVEIFRVVTKSGKTVHGVREETEETYGGGWYSKANLYDNKEDCKAETHSMCHYWEELRKIQMREAGP